MNQIIRFSRYWFPLVFALVLISGSAAAATVTIVNPSFEDPALADGGYTSGSIAGWSAAGSAARGVLNPTPTLLVAPPDGVQVGYLDGGGSAVSISQTLTAVLVAGEIYVLQADFAYRLNCCNTPSFTLALLAGGSEVASFTGGPADGFSNTAFKTATVNFIAPTVGPLLGSALGIRISMVAPTNEQIVVDNVRLNASPSPVPVPASGLLLLPALGWFVHYRGRAPQRSAPT